MLASPPPGWCFVAADSGCADARTGDGSSGGQTYSFDACAAAAAAASGDNSATSGGGSSVEGTRFLLVAGVLLLATGSAATQLLRPALWRGEAVVSLRLLALQRDCLMLCLPASLSVWFAACSILAHALDTDLASFVWFNMELAGQVQHPRR